MELSDRATLAIVDVDEVLNNIKQNPRVAIQFMGDKGRGKTTHLLALKQHFPDAAYLHVPEDTTPKRIPHGVPLFLDETQRIPRWRRRLVFRRNVPLIIGTHENHEAELRRAGRDVQTIFPGESTDADRLNQIIEHRIEWSRRSPGRVPRVRRETINAMLRRFGDDVRAIEHELYETFQQLTENTDV